ncbi:MAG: nitrogen regulation protein NR(I) [Alphaproteobacteria bacterium]|jgi:two-component system nitrogen regulation response regulator GlnG
MSKGVILLADDDRSIRTVLTHAFMRAGFEVKATGNASTLWRWVSEGLGNIVVTDVVMPDENGLDLLPKIRRARPELRVIVISGQNTLMTAIRATERGAFEYFPKPFDIRELVNVAERAIQEPANVTQPERSDNEEDRLPLKGRSAAMQDVYRMLARLMGTDLTVLITGESGVGKELAARVLHDFGPRKRSPFVAINMAAIPRELIESELFGHERGAFTGATARSAGRFEQAEGGTLFLDEIGDMPHEAQTRLLRVLQQGEYVPVGGASPIKANVRIVSATHRDLRESVRQGEFREDLFYRLNVVPLRLPALRERVEDIPELVNHFLQKSEGEGLPRRLMSNGAMEALRKHNWPGNVRELENLIRRLIVMTADETISADSVLEILSEYSQGTEQKDAVDQNISGSLDQLMDRFMERYFQELGQDLPSAGLYTRIIEQIEIPLLTHMLSAVNGNQVKAAEVLGINRNTLRKKIKTLGLPVIKGVVE